MKTGLFERILENIFFFQFIPSLTSSRKRQIRTPFSEIYFYHLPSGQQKGCADSVLTGSFPGPPSGQIPVESCEHPPPYASGLGYLVIREVFRLTPRMIVHRGPIDHAIEWRVLAAFCCILGSNCQKSQTYGQKLGRHFMAWSKGLRCTIILGVRRKASRKTKYPKPDACGGGCSQDSTGICPEGGP